MLIFVGVAVVTNIETPHLATGAAAVALTSDALAAVINAFLPAGVV